MRITSATTRRGRAYEWKVRRSIFFGVGIHICKLCHRERLRIPRKRPVSLYAARVIRMVSRRCGASTRIPRHSPGLPSVCLDARARDFLSLSLSLDNLRSDVDRRWTWKKASTNRNLGSAAKVARSLRKKVNRLGCILLEKHHEESRSSPFNCNFTRACKSSIRRDRIE